LSQENTNALKPLGESCSLCLRQQANNEEQEALQSAGNPAFWLMMYKQVNYNMALREIRQAERGRAGILAHEWNRSSLGGYGLCPPLP
jgi:hypothetical protein